MILYKIDSNIMNSFNNWVLYENHYTLSVQLIISYTQKRKFYFLLFTLWICVSTLYEFYM